MTSEERAAVTARRHRLIAVALAALGTATHCHPEARPVQPLPEARAAPPPSGPTWQPIDRDHDGVSVSDDACPTEAEDRDEIDDADGCPETDADADGAVDEVDVCPTQPGRGARHGRGCPTMAVMDMPRPVILEVIYFDAGQTTVPKEFDSLIP